MGASKREKKVRQEKIPKGKSIGQGGNPDQFYSLHPSWNFSSCDMKLWSIYDTTVKTVFWDEILPRMRFLETQTWDEILIKAKKQNHSIMVESLNKGAIERLTELYIEAEAIYSLTIQGNHRIYGTIVQGVFNILWIDLDHGDNAECVCRSRKKHT